MEDNNIELTENTSEDIGHIVTADEVTVDEEAVNIEKEKAEIESKKKKSKKTVRIIIIVVIVVLLLAAAGGFIGYKVIKKNKDNTVKIETTIGQSVEFVKIDSINGNEINYTVLEEAGSSTESMDSFDKSNRPSFGDGEKPSDMPSFGDGEKPSDMPSFGDGEMPSDMPSFGNGEKPSDMPSFGNGEKPSDMPSFGNGEMPSDMPSFGNGEMPSDMPSFGGGNFQKESQDGGFASVLTYDGKEYRLTDKFETAMIPVGTEVITKLGTATSFSRIQNGDCLAIVTEEIDGVKTIMAVYIVG